MLGYRQQQGAGGYQPEWAKPEVSAEAGGVGMHGNAVEVGDQAPARGGGELEEGSPRSFTSSIASPQRRKEKARSMACRHSPSAISPPSGRYQARSFMSAEHRGRPGKNLRRRSA